MGNLIPINTLPPEKQLELQRKGGQAKSARKTFANSIKSLKTGKYSKHFSEKVARFLKDPAAMDADILAYIGEIEKLDLTTHQKLILVDKKISAKKAVFGEKRQIESTNINLNATVEVGKELDDIEKDDKPHTDTTEDTDPAKE